MQTINVRRLALSKVTTKIIGKPYSIGCLDYSEGLDCLSLIRFLANEWGVKLPDVFEGISWYSYKEIWLKYPKWTKTKLLKFVSKLGERIDPVKMFPPDLIVFDLAGELHIGICAGVNSVLSVFTNRGVSVIGVDEIEIKRVYRWVAVTI